MSCADYVLGTTDAEHARLIRQAEVLAPLTERLFRDAGIGAGQRVLDVGCGVGDVSMLVAGLVGPDGRVVGIDQDAGALAKARGRCARAGIGNVEFVESDITAVGGSHAFDAIVGRLILQFLPDPVAVIGHLSRSLRPGGVIVFAEACWASYFAHTAHLPLGSACARLLERGFAKSGAYTDMERVLYRAFRANGLPAPKIRIETPVGSDPGMRRWLADLYGSMRPKIVSLGLADEAIGDPATLAARLDAELDQRESFAAVIGIAGVWARTAQA